MSGQNRDLTEAIRTLSGVDQLSYESMVCKVSEIDTTKFTCTCSPIDGSADYIEIPYNVGAVKGFVLEPKDGSYIALTTTSETTGFVSMVSEVNQIYLNGDNEGGLVKVQDLVDRLNDIKNVVNDLITKFNSHTHPYLNVTTPAFTSPTAMQEAGSVPNTTVSQLENTKIKHGS